MHDEWTPRGIVFDMDGVLVDSTPIHEEAFRRTTEARAIPFPGYGIIAGMRTDAAFRFLTGDTLDAATLRACVDEKRAHFQRLAGEVPPFMPGAVETVRALAARSLSLGLATSGSRASMLAFLKASALGSVFSVTLCGDDVAHAKPSPEIYRRAFSALHLEPREGWVVEDAANGFLAATAAGAACILFRPNADTRVRYGAHAHAVIDDLANLLDRV